MWGQLATAGIAAAPAIISGIASLFGKNKNKGTGEGNFFQGQPSGVQSTSGYAPWQQQGLESLFNMGQQKLQNPYAGFDMTKNQAVQNYNENILPGMLESFASTGGAPSSPVFGSQLAQGGSQLGQAIEMMRNQYGLQNQQLGANLVGQGLNPIYSQYQQQGQPGFLETGFPSLLKLAGAGVGAAARGGQDPWSDIFSIFSALGGNMQGTNQLSNQQLSPLGKTNQQGA